MKLKNVSKYKILKNVILIMAVLIMAITMQSTFAADTTINPGNGTISGGMGSVNNGETLTLDPGTYNGTSNTGLTINKAITIRGNGPTGSVIIDAEGQRRIFAVTSQLTFCNITFINGRSASNGGAILCTGTTSTFKIINCTFINNTLTAQNSANGQGGAICHVGGANTSIVNCSFINNTAYQGGAVHYMGASTTGGSIINCNFTGNKATSSGGVLRILSNNFTMIGCFGANNTASMGAVIGFTEYSAGSAIRDCSIYNSTFIDNFSQLAVVYSNAVNFDIVGCNFTNNTCNASLLVSVYNHTVINCTFIGNSGKYGGGILISNGTYGSVCVINGSTFINNSQAITFNSTNNFQLNNNTIKDNIIAFQFIFNGITYTIPDLINPSSVVGVANVVANNTYVIGISGSNSIYTLSNSNYNTSGNRNGVIFTGNGSGSTTNSLVASGNRLINSVISGYSGVGVTFDVGSSRNNISGCNISNNGVGVVISGGNNTIVSSNIFNNVLGVNVTNSASGSVINYNRIINNTNLALSNYGVSTNANLNWWGQNIITSLYTNSGSMNLAYWYVLQLSLNNNLNNTINTTRSYPKYQSATLSYRLALNDNFTVTNTPNLLPYFTVNVYLNNSTSVILTFTGQDARTYTYSNNSVYLTNLDPSAQIRAAADNEDLYLKIENTTEEVNLTITKTANISSVLNGQQVTYTITVTNRGPDNATGLSLIEILNSKLILVDYNCSAGTSWNGSIWTIGNLNNGSSVTLNITVRLNGTGTINNNITVNAIDQENIGNNYTEINITSNPAVNLTIVKTVSVPVGLTVGSTVVYTITVTNHGPDNATGVVVIDDLNGKLVYLGNNGSAGYSGGRVTWNVGNLNVGQSVSLTVTVRVNGTGTIPNIANVTVVEPNVGMNNSGVNVNSNATIILPATVNLTIVKTVSVPVGLTVGSTVVYTITVTNHGPDNGTNVVVGDKLDSRLVYISSSATKGSYDYNSSNWTIGNLELGETVSLNITVRVNGIGEINNTANITVNEPNIGNNSTGGNITFNSRKKITNSTIIVRDNLKVDHNIIISGIAIDEFDISLANIVLNIIVDGKTYSTTTNSEGVWNLTLNPLYAGKFSFIVKWMGNDTYYGFNNLTVTTISKYESNIDISTNTISEGDNSKIRITLKDENSKVLANKKVTITINGKSYTRITNSKGMVILNLKGLKGGKHIINAKFSGSDSHHASVNSNSHLVKPRVDLAIVGIKVLKSYNKQVVVYKVTIQNKGSLRSKATTLVFWHIRKGIKIKNKYAKISPIRGGKKKSFIVSYYPDRDHHKYCVNGQYFVVNPKKTMNELTYKNNKALLHGVHHGDHFKRKNQLNDGKIASKLKHVNGGDISHASMKKTGTPFLAILVILLSSIGLLTYYRRKK